ncbi:MAG: hypothetical protein M1837_005235 [Sclerophora amabilis]|nr:MAG: hypothetical protein M1837_005235 [Sclerophora amabilis]
MGVDKKILKNGDQTLFPQKGDTVTIEYTGCLYDSARAEQDYKGQKFDSSIGRGDFVTTIGEGKVIKGWDEGVLNMSLGEKSTLIISRSVLGSAPNFSVCRSFSIYTAPLHLIGPAMPAL